MALSHKVAIYVPSKVGSTKVPALHRTWLKKVLTGLGVMFGGSTYVKGVGTWVGADGGLVAEKVGICYSFSDAASLNANKSAVFDLAREVAVAMSQEAVAVEMDGTLFFVKGEVPAPVAA